MEWNSDSLLTQLSCRQVIVLLCLRSPHCLQGRPGDGWEENSHQLGLKAVSRGFAKTHFIQKAMDLLVIGMTEL